MLNNIYPFYLKYGTQILDGGPLQKYLGTLADKTWSDEILSGEYYSPVDVGYHKHTRYTVNYSTSSIQVFNSG